MRFIGKFIVAVLEIFVLALALNGLLSGLFGLPEAPLVGLLPEAVVPAGPWSERFYWLVLLALPVLHWLVLVSVFRRGRSIVFSTSPTDSLSLTRSAVSQCVRTELAEVPSIVKHKVIISQAGRRAIDLLIELKVKPIENIPEMQARLGRQIRRALSEIMGLENIRHIKVNVTSLEEPRKRRSDGPVPVARRLEGPRSEAPDRDDRVEAKASAQPVRHEESEPQDAEFSVEEDSPGEAYSSLSGDPSSQDDSAVEIAGYGDSSEGPREIDLGDVDAPPEPAPQPGPVEIKTDDLLEIIGKSKPKKER